MNAVMFIWIFSYSFRFVSGWMSQESHVNEVHPVEIILMHNPETEVKLSSFDYTSYQMVHAPDPTKAEFEHRELRKLFEAYGIKVHLLKEVLLHNTVDTGGNLIQGHDLENLRAFASQRLTYDLSYLKSDFYDLEKLLESLSGKNRSMFESKLLEIRPQLDEKYHQHQKQIVIKESTPHVLVDIILNLPTVRLRIKHWFTEDNFFAVVKSEVTIHPMETLCFTRDHAIYTSKGIVMLNPSPLREGETQVIEFVLRKLSVPIVAKIETGFAEGGDFLLLGNIAIVGKGLFTTWNAIKEMMRKDVFGTDEVAVLKCNMTGDKMHLKDVLNVLTEDKILVFEAIMNVRSTVTKTFDVYRRMSVNGTNSIGSYELVENNVPIINYFRERNIEVISFSTIEQQAFAADFLNIGYNTILTQYNEHSFPNNLAMLGIRAVAVQIDNLIRGRDGLQSLTLVLQRLALQSPPRPLPRVTPKTITKSVSVHVKRTFSNTNATNSAKSKVTMTTTTSTTISAPTTTTVTIPSTAVSVTITTKSAKVTNRKVAEITTTKSLKLKTPSLTATATTTTTTTAEKISTTTNKPLFRSKNFIVKTAGIKDVTSSKKLFHNVMSTKKLPPWTSKPMLPFSPPLPPPPPPPPLSPRLPQTDIQPFVSPEEQLRLQSQQPPMWTDSIQTPEIPVDSNYKYTPEIYY